MVREHLTAQGRTDPGFVWRAHEVSRLEGFVDAVFAFAVTLLVVSLEPPRTYAALMEAMRGLVAFAICFAILFSLWRQHFVFSRRYGLQDRITHGLSAGLVFVVLFYVYPLHFLFVFLTDAAMGIHERLPDGAIAFAILPGQTPQVMALYGLGFAAVFLMLALLYGHAYRQREALELTPLERLKTLQALVGHTAMAALGALASVLALSVPVELAGISGFIYFLSGPLHTAIGFSYGRRIRRLQREQGALPG